MAKKLGDPQNSTPSSLSDLTQDMARNLDHRDPRFERLWNFEPFPKMFAPQGKGDTGLIGSDLQIQAILGSNRSGKSYFGALLATMMYTGIVPPSMQGRWGFEDKLKNIVSGPNARPRHVRIVVMDYAEHWPIVIEPMLTDNEFGLLPEPWSTFDKQQHIFRGPDGSMLDIYSADPSEKREWGDPKIRGGRIDLTWVDEINREDIYTESVVRAAAHKDSPGMLILTFCPQQGYKCWTFETFFKACYEMKGNIAVRKPVEDCSRDIYTLHVSMKDNPLISSEEYQRQKRLYKPWEVAYRVDGWYSNRAKNPYFDIETLLAWEQEERYSAGMPFRVIEQDVNPEEGKFKGRLERLRDADVVENGIFDESVFPVWRIWELPKEGEKYIIPADVASGNPKADPQSVSVWKCTDKTRTKQVAQLHMVRIKPGELAQQTCCMGNIYGNCLVVNERNNDPGGTFSDRARNYSNLYKEIKIDKETEESTEKIGWRTTRYNKGAMLETTYKALSMMAAELVAVGVGADGKVKYENWCPFSSRVTLQEFIGFEERLEESRKGEKTTVWAAKSGAHDDTVLEACIGFRIIFHEYGLISSCKFAKTVKASPEDNHYLGRKTKSVSRSFTGWRKQPSLQTLRNRNGRY